MSEDKRERLRYKSVTSWIYSISFFISFVTLIVYLAEADFNDVTLFVLLIVIRYSSFLVCLCSLYKIFMHFFGIFKGYKFSFKRIFFLFGLLFYGMSVIIFESFIAVISGGNG